MFIYSLGEANELTKNDIIIDINALCVLLNYIKTEYTNRTGNALNRDARQRLKETLLERLVALGASVRTRRDSQPVPSTSQEDPIQTSADDSKKSTKQPNRNQRQKPHSRRPR